MANNIEMLINFVPGQECRIAICEDGTLEEFYHERASLESHVGSIYEGRVTNVEASIQAAFIDFGLERNGFLHISDLHPMYFPGEDREEFEKVGQKTSHKDRPPIQKCLRRGQKVLVQVLKEGIGTKGPTLTSYLSIPGRYLVMMPHMQRLGVSRKVEDEDLRREMRKQLDDLNPPKGFGFIVRTAGIGQTKAELKRDLAYLQRLWRSIEKRRKQLKGPGELYAESDLIIRTIRDVFSNDISRIVVDDPIAASRAHEFLTVANPRAKSAVAYYNDPVPLFHRFNVESQIDVINSREVPLPSGGSLVIDQTEALVAIDVNSGKSRDARDSETNAYNTNVEAVDEIARQLRLRDLGGVIVNDLIDMRDPKRRRKIEQRFRDHLKKDRARTRVNAISQFGLLEMTRQRMRPAVGRAFRNKCTHCQGTGYVKSAETTSIEVMRQLAMVMQRKDLERIELTVSPDTAFQLLNHKRSQLVAMENRFTKSVMVRVGGGSVDYISIAAYDTRGGMLDSETLAESMKIAQPTSQTFMKITDKDFKKILESAATSDSPLPASYLSTEPDDFDESESSDEQDQNKSKGKDKSSSRGKKQDDAEKSEDTQVKDNEEQDDASDGEQSSESNGKRRRRRGSRGGRRQRKGGSKDKDANAQADSQNGETDENNADDSDASFHPQDNDRSGNDQRPSDQDAQSDASDTQHGDSDPDNNGNDGSGEQNKDGASSKSRKRRKRRRRSKSSNSQNSNNDGNDREQNTSRDQNQNQNKNDNNDKSRDDRKNNSRQHDQANRSSREPKPVTGGYSNRILGEDASDASASQSPSYANAQASSGEDAAS